MSTFFIQPGTKCQLDPTNDQYFSFFAGSNWIFVPGYIKKRWHTSWKFQLEITSNNKVIAKKPLTNLYEMNCRDIKVCSALFLNARYQSLRFAVYIEGLVPKGCKCLCIGTYNIRRAASATNFTICGRRTVAVEHMWARHTVMRISKLNLFPVPVRYR